MGRWTTKPGSQHITPATKEASTSSKNPSKGSIATASALVAETPSAAPAIPARSQSAESAADAAAEEALMLLQDSSLSEAERQSWLDLCNALAVATPPPNNTKTGPPPPEVLAAMQSARKARDEFIAGLSPQQKEEVQKLLELEKKERKLRCKEDSSRWKEGNAADTAATNEAAVTNGALKKQQKEIMTQAFWLWQQDQKKVTGSNTVDSTEWKLVRARGGDDATLRRYLVRAGWDTSWLWPQPEGRLLRREGKEAAVARYSRT